MKSSLAICFVVALVWSCADCRLQHHQTHPVEQLEDGTPSCTYDKSVNQVQCYYLQASNMDLLEQALQEVAEFVDSFGVALYYVDGDSIPLNSFLHLNITELSFYGCDLSLIPYELLASVGTLLQNLKIGYNNFTIEETTAPIFPLQFSDFLTDLEISETNIKRINPSTFSQYINLRALHLYANNITSIGLELLGLDMLENLYYEFNDILSIKTGAFGDLKNLSTLFLESNNLSNLQDGAFNGLETSPITEIALGGNPWNCTCDLQWLKDWLDVRNLTNSSEAYCAYPTEGYFSDVNFC